MCYKLKTLFMKKIIAKKQKAKPFDYEAAESFALSESEDPTVNNSYYFSAHGERESLYCRLGIRSTHSEVWFYYSDGENRYALTDMLHKENVPLKVQRSEHGWLIKYSGELTSGNGEKIHAEFGGEYVSDQPPVDFFSNMPPVRTAKAMAGEKWNKKFFSEVQANNQVHYEQTGRISGSLDIGGKIHIVDLPCVRDHSYGKRDWNYMNNHLWLMAVNENSQLNFSMVSYPAMTVLEVGNFKKAGEPMAYALEASYDRALIAAGHAPEKFGLLISLDNGHMLNIAVNKTDEYVYLFQEGDYKLIEGIAEFTIDDEKYRGILEVGFNKEEGRIFNGREIRKLKV